MVAPVVAVLASSGAGAAVAFNSSLTRAPYLTDLVGTHVNVNWATSTASASTGSLQWGSVSGTTCSLNQTQVATRSTITVGTVSEYQWKVALSLPSEGTYCYRPLLAAVDLLGTASSPTFQTQVAVGDSTPFSFDVFGDWGRVDVNGASPDMANLFAQVARSGARFALTVGDNGYPNGSQINYGDLQQTGVDTSAIFGPAFWTVAGSSIPLFTAAGNHGLSGPTHTDISTWTEDSAVASSNGRDQNDVYCCVNGSSTANYGSEWYAFSAGEARFYMLDSAWGDTNGGNASPYANDFAAHFQPGTPEYNWLLNDLQTHPTALKFAFSHYPFYVDNPNESSDPYLQGANSLEGLLGRYGVQIAFNGHAHLYQRNTPSAPGMPVTYVTGGGGGALEPIGPCSANDAYGIGWSPSKNTGTACGAGTPVPTFGSQVYHFLKVSVSGTSVTVAPTDENGNTFDVQTYAFSRAPNTYLDSNPAAHTSDSTATLTFNADRPGSTFACSLDGAAATACQNPLYYSGLAAGAHTFSVRATNASGTDPSPAVATWTVDASPPTQPAGVTSSTGPGRVIKLAWSASSDNDVLSGYDVLRNGLKVGSVGASTTSFGDLGGAPGTSYQYTVVAVDGAGNRSTASAPVSVLTPPAVSGPALVQSAASSSTTVTLPATSSPGDLLVLTSSVYTGASKLITAVTDGKNTWTKAAGFNVAGQNSDGEIWYAPNAAAVSAITVKTTAAVALNVQEYSGVAASTPLDGTVGLAASSTVAASGAVTPSAGTDLAVGFVAGHANAQSMTVSTPGYVVGAQQTTSGSSIVTLRTAQQALTTATAQSLSSNFPSGMYWSTGLALFKAATGAASPPADFSVTIDPHTVTVLSGHSATYRVSTTLTSGSAQTLSLSAGGLASGATASFSPASVTSGQSSIMTLTTPSSQPSSNSTVVVSAAGASFTHSDSAVFGVAGAASAAPPDFSMTATPSSLSLPAGQIATSTISTSTISGAAQGVALSASGMPTGVSVSFSPSTVISGQASTMTMTASSAAAIGTYSVVVTGTSSSATHTSVVSVIVPAPDFSISASPSAMTVVVGQSSTSTIATATTSGADEAVALSATGAPTGATVSFAPTSVSSGQSSVLTFTTAPTTAVGTYSVVVNAQGASATHSTTVTVTIAAGAPQLVQSASATESAPATTLTAALPAASHNGDLLVVAISEYVGATNHVTSVTDTAGNIWARVNSWNVSGHNSNAELWYSDGSAPSTAVTIHMGSAATAAIQVQEFSGIAATGALDTSSGSANTGVASDSGAITPVAGELVVGVVAGHTSAQAMSVTSSGFTLLGQQNSTGSLTTVRSGYRVTAQAVGSNFAATFPAAMYWASGIASFRSAS